MKTYACLAWTLALVALSSIARADDTLPIGAVVRLGSARLTHEEVSEAVALSPDGRLLAGWGGEFSWTRTSRELRVWDRATGELLGTLPGSIANSVRESQGTRVAWSPDGTLLATVDGWCDARASRWMVKFKEPESAVAFLPDGRRLASINSRGFVRLRDLKSGEVLWSLDSDPHVAAREDEIYGTSVAALPSGRELLATSQGLVHVIDVATGEVLRVLTAPSKVHIATCSPDGKTVAGTNGSSVSLWDLPSGDFLFEVQAGTRDYNGSVYADGVCGLTILPDNRTLVTSGRGNTVLRSLDSGRELRRIKSGGVGTAAGYADPKSAGPKNDSITVVTTGRRVQLWDAATGREVTPVDGHAGKVLTAQFQGADRIVTVDDTTTIRFWEASTGKGLGKTSRHERADAAILSADGKWAASCATARQLTVWRTDNGELLRCRQGAYLHAPLLFDPRGKGPELLFSEENRLERWDLEKDVTAAERKELEYGAVSAIAVPGTATLITAAHDGALRMWEAGKADAVKTIPTDKYLAAMALSPDGKQIALAAGYNEPSFCGNTPRVPPTLKVWDLAGGKVVREMNCQCRTFERLAFSPDGRTLAATSKDGTARVWDLETGEQLLLFTKDLTQMLPVPLDRENPAPPPKPLRIVVGSKVDLAVFSPDGKRLLTNGPGSAPLVWDLRLAMAQAASLEKLDEKLNTGTCWKDLASGDAATTRRAIWIWSTLGDAGVKLLSERLTPTLSPLPKPDALERLVRQLDADDFEARQRATRELAGLGSRIGPFLQRQMKKTDSVEVRKRIDAVLASLNETGEERRTQAALEILRNVGGPEAQKLTRAISASPE